MKAFHVAAVVTWVGGMLAASLLVSIFSASSQSRSRRELGAIASLRRWDRLVTGPAMLIVWGLGITLAIQANWFASRWLMLKLTLVIALSALHGVQSGTLRRMSGGSSSKPPAFLRFAAPLTLAAVTMIAILAVTKPF